MVPRGKQRRQREFGKLRQLPSGKWQASHLDDDGERHNAPMTFTAKQDAQAWLRRQQSALEDGTWAAKRKAAAEAAAKQQAQAETLGEYAARWIAERKSLRGEPIRVRTREEYSRLLRTAIAPLAAMPVGDLTPARVRSWHDAIDRTGTRTTAARAYGLLRSVYATAVEDGIVVANPVSIRGAQNGTTGRKVPMPTQAQVDALLAALPDRYRAMILLAANTGLRSGELRELRRGDLQLAPQRDGRNVYVLSVARAVSRTAEGHVVGPPKTAAGVRTLIVPANVTAALGIHLAEYVQPGADALLFPSPADPTRHLPTTTLYGAWYPAREAAGRPDLTVHALRGFHATRYAQHGATLAETMGRLGHASPAAAMRYQHVAEGRDAELVARLAAGK